MGAESDFGDFGSMLSDPRRGALAVTIIAAPDARSRAERTVLGSARTVGETSDWPGVPGWIADAPLAPLVFAEAGTAADAALAAALPSLDRWARESAVSVVVAMEPRQVDLVTTLITGPRVQWLCAASEAERIAALTVASAWAMTGTSGFRDPARDAGYAARLARVAAEVARIAETLTGLVDEADPATVGERRRIWGAAPAEASAAVSAGDVRAAIRARRLRDGLFGAGWFEDPAWDMLLDLFAADLERADVSVSSLCIAAAVAPTTALRWIMRMEEAGLIERRPDPRDRRRMFTILSAEAQGLMRRYWTSAASALA